MKKIDDIDIYNFTDSKNSVMYDQYWDSNIGELIHGINKIKNKYVGAILKSVLNDIISLKTAKGRALDMWGLLLNFNRSIEFNDNDLLIDLNNEDFDNLEIINNDPTKKRGSLKDDAYRTVLQLRLHAQNTLADVVFMSPLLSDVVGSRISINDELDMRYVTYYVKDELPAWLDVTLSELDILPRPAGCGSKIESSLYRYVYFYPGANIKELGTFYFSIFYGEEDNLYYKSIKKYINPTDLYKPFLTWYNPNLYTKHIKKDEDSIKARCLQKQNDYEKIEYLEVLIEGYAEEVGDIFTPELWSKKKREVDEEYTKKDEKLRNDMPESWHIKEIQLELINAKRSNYELEMALDEVSRIRNNFYLRNKFFYEDEVSKYLFFNKTDGYYYTNSNYTIDSITTWCIHDNYLWNHVGLSDFYTPRWSIFFNDENPENDWNTWKNGNIDRLNQYLEVDNLMMLGIRTIEDDIVYGEMPRNPFYEYWKPKIDELIDKNDKIHNFLGDDKEAKVIGINRFDTKGVYTKKEVMFWSFYQLLLVYRNTNQMLCQQLWDLKQCHLDISTIKTCESIYNKIHTAPAVDKINVDEDKNLIHPIQTVAYYDHMSLIYKQTADDFQKETHANDMAELYKLRADNIRLQSQLFNEMKKLHYIECRDVIKNTFLQIGSEGYEKINDIKKELLDIIGDVEDKHWIEEFCDTYSQRCLALVNIYSDEFENYKGRADNFLNEDRFNTWIKSWRVGHSISSDFDFLLKDKDAAKEAIEVAKGMWELGTFAKNYNLDLNGIKNKMHLISDDKIRKVGWDPNNGSWRKWQKDLVDNMSGDPRYWAGRHLREYADKLETQFTNLYQLRTCEINQLGIRARYLTSRRNKYIMCNSRILGDNDWYREEYPNSCKHSMGDYKLPDDKFSASILDKQAY